MKLLDAYNQAINEDADIPEWEEYTSESVIKQDVLDEILESMKEIRDLKASGNSSPKDMVHPMFKCVSFWFLIGIRVGKIMRDEELAGE